jgi:HAD superfamily hydrolase (TIGR01450 family)
VETKVHPCLREWLARERGRIEAVVLDIDGVLIRHRRALPGAVELLAVLRDSGTPYTLLTNDGCSSPAEKVAYLRSGGIRVEEEEIYSSSHALIELVAERGLRGERFFVMGKLGEPSYAEAAGLVATHDLDAMEGTRGIIVGETGYDWESTVNAAVNFLIRRPDALFICPNPDLYFPVRDGRIRLASGAIAHLIREMLERYGGHREPVYLGKPYAPVFAASHARLERLRGSSGGLARSRVLMVGDSLAGDIAGGRSFGYRTALVLTGLTTAEMVGRAEQRETPELVFEGL